MTKRNYEKLIPYDVDIVDHAFEYVALEVKHAGYPALYDDTAEKLINAITEYLLKCKEKPHDKT